MWTHEHSIDIDATPSRIWTLFADVAGWKRWNAGIEDIHMNGPFAEGSTFSMKPPGEDAFVSTLIEVADPSLFTDETVIDGTCVRVFHRIAQLPGGGCRVTYRTEIDGPAAATFGPMVTGDFPDVFAALKRLAEQAS